MTYNNKLKELVQTDRFGKIEYTNEISEAKIITKTDDLISIKIEDNICNNGNFIGSVTAKKATIYLINTDNKYNVGNENLINKEITISTGAIVDIDTEDELTVTNSWGTFIVTSVENLSTEGKCKIEAYDKIIYLNKTYVSNVAYPSTIADIFQSVCSQCSLTYSEDAFTNDDFVVDNDQYADKSCREVISHIAKLAMGFVKISGDTVSIQTLGTTPVTNTLTANTAYTMEIFPVTTPINRLAIGLSVVTGGETTREDATSIATYGQNELRLNDIGFTYTSELRELVIDDMFTAISGLSFIPFSCDYMGYDNVSSGNMITLVDLEGNSYNTYIFNHTFIFDGGFKGTITTEALSKSENTYNNSNTSANILRKAQISIDANKSEITSLASRTSANESAISQITQDVDGVQVEVQKIYGIEQDIASIEIDISGINQVLSTKGGANLLPNSVKQFGDGEYTGTFLNHRDTETEINLLSKSAIVIDNGTDSIEITVPNGDYFYACRYKKLIGLSTCSVTINGTEIEFVGTEWTTLEHPFSVAGNKITILYTGDTNDSCWVGDVLIVQGSTSQPWSPNSNEIYTDTVQIGQGITITSNTSNTTFKADTSGTKVYNNNDLDVPVSEFTDDGVSTDNIVANKGTIAKLIFTDMGTQTWITRI